MKRPLLFGVCTFFLGWIFQSVFFTLFKGAEATPQWLLLVVLALGGMGQTNLAQSVGFFWGLCLDVHSVSLFGAQAWLLAGIGFLTGRLSRELNSEKLMTQEVLTFCGTGIFYGGLICVERLFRGAENGFPVPGFFFLLLEFLLNGLAAPVVFWGVRWWRGVWRD